MHSISFIGSIRDMCDAECTAMILMLTYGDRNIAHAEFSKGLLTMPQSHLWTINKGAFTYSLSKLLYAPTQLLP